MTLIVALMSPVQVILVSDRRLTADGQLIDDEQNKATALFCQDGRAAVAFTGMARVGKFETSGLLLDALSHVGQLDHSLVSTVGQLVGILSEEVGKLKVPPSKRHLTVVVAGYRYDVPGPPRAVLWQITNGTDKTGLIGKLALDKFTSFQAKDSREDIGVFGLFGFGSTVGVTGKDRFALRELVLHGAPASAQVDKAVDTIRNAAKSPKSRGLVGEQCNSIILPADITKGARADYHSTTVQNQMYFPNIVVSTSNMSLTNQGAYIEQLDSTTAPLIVPKVGRNKPCPCGSGKKFKRCCGPRLQRLRARD